MTGDLNNGNDELVADMLPIAAALTCAVADRNPAEVQPLLGDLDTRELHALAVLLAAHVDPDKPFRLHPGATPIIDAVRAAAIRFRVTESLIRSDSRDRGVADARAVACYVARLAGMSSPQIGKYIGRDHSTVLNASARVGGDARLRAVAAGILTELDIQVPRDQEAEAS